MGLVAVNLGAPGSKPTPGTARRLVVNGRRQPTIADYRCRAEAANIRLASMSQAVIPAALRMLEDDRITTNTRSRQSPSFGRIYRLSRTPSWPSVRNPRRPLCR